MKSASAPTASTIALIPHHLPFLEDLLSLTSILERTEHSLEPQGFILYCHAVESGQIFFATYCHYILYF